MTGVVSRPGGLGAPPAGADHAGAAVASGWHDLAHVVTEEMARIATFPAPRIGRLLCRPGDPMNVTTVELCCHVGTHVDAPLHFIDGAPSIDELPLDRFHGPGVVVDAPADDYGRIDVEVFRAARPAIRPGDIVLVHAGWSRFFGEDRYDRHPSLTEAAAAWLVERGVKLVGVDFGTPDIALDRRPAGFDWPVHRILLGSGVLVVEHLRGLAPLVGRRLEVVCLPINVRGADGAPARVVARPWPGDEQDDASDAGAALASRPVVGQDGAGTPASTGDGLRAGGEPANDKREETR